MRTLIIFVVVVIMHVHVCFRVCPIVNIELDTLVHTYIQWSLSSPAEKAAVVTDVKELYQKYSSAIFFVFYSYFGSLESAILDKGQSATPTGRTH